MCVLIGNYNFKILINMPNTRILLYPKLKIEYASIINCQKVSEYDQKVPGSHTVDQPTAP